MRGGRSVAVWPGKRCQQCREDARWRAAAQSSAFRRRGPSPSRCVGVRDVRRVGGCGGRRRPGRCRGGPRLRGLDRRRCGAQRRQTRSGRSGHGRRSRWGRDGCADHRRSPHRDRQLLGSAVPRRDIPEYAQMWREGRLPVEHLISSRIRLTDINSAMDQLADGTVIRQVIIFDQIVFFGRVRRDGRSRRMIARRFLPGCRSRVVEMCPWGGRARRSPRGVGAAPAG